MLWMALCKGIIQRAGIGSEERDRRLRSPSNIGLAHVGESQPMHRPPLSVLDGNVVVNASLFGKELWDFLQQPAQLGLLSNCGYMNGGCWTLAEALRIWSGGAFTLFAVKDVSPAHIVCGFVEPRGLVVLDGDGMAWEEELRIKMRLREGFQAADVVAFDREEVSRNGIIFAAEPARQYARRLEWRFGPFSWLRILDGTDLGPCRHWARAS